MNGLRPRVGQRSNKIRGKKPYRLFESLQLRHCFILIYKALSGNPDSLLSLGNVGRISGTGIEIRAESRHLRAKFGVAADALSVRRCP
jgi:hypothetical protein